MRSSSFRVHHRTSILLCCAMLLAAGTAAPAGWLWEEAHVNAPQAYPRQPYGHALNCIVDAGQDLGSVDRRIFGTNVEWFHNGDGLATTNVAAYLNLVDLARDQGISVYRFPGGTLSDYYDWNNGVGAVAKRPVSPDGADSGASANNFGSPELFRLMLQTNSQALLTVNAGTGTAAEAAGWVAYANSPGNAQRSADGFTQPVGVKLWEVGNELYLPSNAGIQNIAVTPQVYAQRFVQFADAMRAVDPSITVIAIGTAIDHSAGNTQYPNWTQTLLQADADKIDMIAVHNAYFPVLTGFLYPPSVKDVYPALWAAPEAVDQSLTDLETLIARYEGKRQIGIAVTEWGGLFAEPAAGDKYEWVDHVKTLGSGVYAGRVLQVFMSHPRVKVANYFKYTDSTFMGWVDYLGRPKVPYWVLKLYARYSGDRRVQASVDAPTDDVPALGSMSAQSGVAEVTVVATRSSTSGQLYVNFVNRSLDHVHTVQLNLRNFAAARTGQLLSISGPEPTANEGRDIPLLPGWPYTLADDPYSTAPAESIGIQQQSWSAGEPITLPPFSVATLVLSPQN